MIRQSIAPSRPNRLANRKACVLDMAGEVIQTALPNEASGYDWKRETGDIQSYQHIERGGWLHIDSQGQFYDRQAQPIERDQALEKIGQQPTTENELSHRNLEKEANQGLTL